MNSQDEKQDMQEKEQKSYYAVIPAPVRYNKDIPALGKLLYAEITALSNEKGYCWATNEYFAELYNCHTRTISRLINKLKQLNFIQTEIEDRYKRKIYLADSSKCLRGTTKMSNPHDKNSVGDRQKCVDNKVINTKHNTKDNIYKVEIERIIKYLNVKTESDYKPTTNKTISLITARFNDGFKLEDFKIVIDKKVEEWLETDYAKYLRPETLFGNKFEGYLNQKDASDPYDNFYKYLPKKQEANV